MNTKKIMLVAGITAIATACATVKIMQTYFNVQIVTVVRPAVDPVSISPPEDKSPLPTATNSVPKPANNLPQNSLPPPTNDAEGQVHRAINAQVNSENGVILISNNTSEDWLNVYVMLVVPTAKAPDGDVYKANLGTIEAFHGASVTSNDFYGTGPSLSVSDMNAATEVTLGCDLPDGSTGAYVEKLMPHI